MPDHLLKFFNNEDFDLIFFFYGAIFVVNSVLTAYRKNRSVKFTSGGGLESGIELSVSTLKNRSSSKHTSQT